MQTLLEINLKDRISIQPGERNKGGIQLSFMKPKVTTRDLVIFTRQFATMIDSGLPLVQCWDIQPVSRQK